MMIMELLVWKTWLLGSIVGPCDRCDIVVL